MVERQERAPEIRRSHVLDGRLPRETDDGVAGEMAGGGGGDAFFAMRLVVPVGRWSLRLAANGATPRMAAGFDLSQPINAYRQTVRPDPATAIEHNLLSCRLGPDEWFLVADGQVADQLDPQTAIQQEVAVQRAIETALGDDLAAAAHTVVNISHRNVALELTGTGVADVLNTGCLLDLGGRAFPVGTATRTLFSKIEIILIRLPDRGAEPVYRVECWRSFGRYLCAHLQDSACLISAAA